MKNFMNKKIGLIGRGWLGSPLEIALLNNGYHTFSTTSKSFDITKDPIPKKLLESDILIYTIPPLGQKEPERFFSQIDIKKKIIFTSSTSYYGKNQGSVDENTLSSLIITGSPELFETEQFLKNKFKDLTIIRPGGLYGEKRHPVFFLAGRSGLTTGNEHLHLVHQTDCVSAILSILEKNIWAEDFNLVSDLRILKKEYYREMAQKLNLEIPEFSNIEVSNPTNINNLKTKEILGIKFLNPLDYVETQRQ
jgi:nucleoside-diphosphate-sugar epimerase